MPNHPSAEGALKENTIHATKIKEEEIGIFDA